MPKAMNKWIRFLSVALLKSLFAALSGLSGWLSDIGGLAPAHILGSNSDANDGKDGSEVENDLHD